MLIRFAFTAQLIWIFVFIHFVVNVYFFFMQIISIHSRLDPALIRPGRVDVKEKIDYATDYQLQQMFMRFYPDQSEQRAAIFAKHVLSLDKKVSLAQVQGLFLVYKNDPQSILDKTDALWKL